MASLIRQQRSHYENPKTGKRVKKDTPGAVKVFEKERLWYGQGIPGLPPKRRIPLAADKVAAQRMLDDLVRQAERGHAGIPLVSTRTQPLATLVDEFEESVAIRTSARQGNDVAGWVRRVLEGCEIRTMADLTAPGVVAKVESFIWNLTKPPLSHASATAAYAGKHSKQFTRWLWRKKGLLPSDPIAGVSLPSLKPESPRRDLTAQELARLNEATGKFRGLTGPDRAILYLTTVATGYRAWEMGLLTPDHFDLDAEVPVARIKGEDTKNDDLAIQPIPPVLVARLREYLKDLPRQKPIWPGSWHRRAADMLRLDLDRAGIPHLTEAGEVVFHSLRHSYSSLLSQVATVKVTQELVRHSSPNLTIGRYTHAGMAEKAEAVAKLPLPGSQEADSLKSLPRQELENLTGSLLAYAWCLRRNLDTPRLPDTPGDTPPAGTNGNIQEQSETRSTGGKQSRKKKKPL